MIKKQANTTTLLDRFLSFVGTGAILKSRNSFFFTKKSAPPTKLFSRAPVRRSQKKPTKSAPIKPFSKALHRKRRKPTKQDL